MSCCKNIKINHFILAIFWGLIFCNLISLLGHFNWVCSLFEHFRWHYALGFLILILYFFIIKKWPQFFLALLFFLINVFYILDWDKRTVPYSGQGKKIFIHNIHFLNHDYDPFIDQDVNQIDKVFIIENSELTTVKIKEKLKMFTYQIEIKNNLAFNYAVFSKTPIDSFEKIETEGIVPYIHFISDGVQYFFVHLPPPTIARYWALQEKSFKNIINQIKNLKTPWMILGDFNMTPWCHHFYEGRSKLDKAFYSWEKVSYFGSWPMLLPDILKIPIDHVISSENFEFDYGDTYGSDHRSMIVRY